MGAPTWPPDPETARALSLEELGQGARAAAAHRGAGAVQEALLLAFLVEPEAEVGAEGSRLEPHQRRLSAWLSLLGQPSRLDLGDAAGFDRERLILPRALPAPASPADLAWARWAALLQSGQRELALALPRGSLQELHQDLALRLCWGMLAAQLIARRCRERWPGLGPLEGLDRWGRLFLLQRQVPDRGLPAELHPLYAGLHQLPDARPAPGPAAEAVQIARRAPERGAALALLGAAWRLRGHLEQAMLPPPALPRALGLLRPEWLLHDLVAEKVASQLWRQGPTPLRLLRAVAERLRPPPALELPAAPPPPAGEGLPEWDAARGAWRAERLHLSHPPPALARPDESLRPDPASRRALRQAFAALRPPPRWQGAQPDGPELDLDRALLARLDARAGLPPSPRHWRRFRGSPVPVQLLLVVDRSGSGRAGLLREQQRALLGLGPALQGLDLSWSLAAFHSGGPRACAWEALKAWQEPWGSAVEERVGGLRAEGGSRLGAALREIQRQLQLRPAGRRLALLLSDGRAHDGPDYRDAQAELDTRLATAALRQSGVLFLALCLDPSAEEPATRSFGGDHLLVLRRVEELPARLPALLLRQLRPRSGWP